MLVRTGNPFAGIINNTKYANNYDFNKAVYLVNKENFHRHRIPVAERR